MLLQSTIVFILAFILIRLLIRIAPTFGLIDIPNERSVHTAVVPRAAGIGIFTAFVSTCFVFERDLLSQYPFTFLSFPSEPSHHSFFFVLQLVNSKWDFEEIDSCEAIPVNTS